MKFYTAYRGKVTKSRTDYTNTDTEAFKANEYFVKCCNLIYATYSCLCLVKLGHEINLHCDREGYELLKHLPYTNIYIDLENIPYNNCFWAAGKFIAHKAEPLNSIYIDTDVFIQSNKTIDAIINKSKGDILVQNDEAITQQIYYQDGIDWLLSNIPEFNIRYINKQYMFQSGLNCGIIRFINQELKDKYLKLVDNIHWLITESEGFIDKNPNNLDVILEQATLKTICKNYYIKELINTKDDAEEIMYCHLMGPGKYKFNQDITALKAIKNIDLNIYNETIKKIKNYRKGIKSLKFDSKI